MGLREYHRKRHFDTTSEPKGAAPRTRPKPALQFVVQKHAARRLHYDFRLELDGVLLSWAVPKGPSLAPGDKRLAVQVEDHPLEYAGFEGVIPAGEYGGGAVLVWDRGTWTPLTDPRDGLRKGHLEFELDGDKLHGRWRLVRLRARSAKPKEKPAWLLLKGKDGAASTDVDLVDDEPLSVISGRDLETIAADADQVWHSNRAVKSPKKKSAPLDVAKIEGARKGPLPTHPRIELATLVDAPPEGEEWLHEIKLDGYRLLARLDGGEVHLATRGAGSASDWSERFPTIAEAVARLGCKSALLDGEAVVLDAEGKSDFQDLQNALGSRRRDLFYVAFDLLYCDGYDLTQSPLIERKALLQRLLDGAPAALRYSDHMEGAGPALFAKACAAGLEGIVSKRRDSHYAGGRGKTWLKTKCLLRQELVIVGFTEPTGSRPGLGALLLAVHDDKSGALRYAGKVGTGFTQASLRQLRERLEAITRETPAVDVPRAEARLATWVAPELLAEVAFSEWTRGGQVRHASFQGLREDKPAKEVLRERPVHLRVEEVAVAGVRLSHPDKVLYPEAGITKREVAAYYEAVAELILPGLVDRPLTLVRCPEGHTAHCFFQRHANKMVPAAIPRVDVGEKEPYLSVDALPALISLVQLGALELHVWGARNDKLEQPDQVVFDLDPDPSVKWPKVVELARLLEERLEALGLRGFPRVTGGKGLHVVVPIARRSSWEQVKDFAHAMALLLGRERPDDVTVNMAKARRKGRVFIDYLRNARGATAVASYSTRARAGAPIAMPLRWDQLDDDAPEPPRFELRDAAAWAKRHREPWPDFETARPTLPRL